MIEQFQQLIQGAIVGVTTKYQKPNQILSFIYSDEYKVRSA